MEKRYCTCGAEKMPTEVFDIHVCPKCSPNSCRSRQQPETVRVCPKCDTELVDEVVGGRGWCWCPRCDKRVDGILKEVRPQNNPTTFQQLITQMKEAVRDRVKAVEGFDYGAMRFLFVPKSEEARIFLGGFDKEFVDIDLAAPIKEGGSMILPPNYWGRGGDGCNCYGYTGLKIEGCSYVVKNGFGRRSSDCPDEGVIPGRIKSRGAVVFDIKSSLGTHDDVIESDWLRVYSAVSGGNGGEIDEICAMAVQHVLQRFARSMYVAKDHQYVLTIPDSIS